MPAKHALIVGVDKYSNLEKKYELRGCVNDAKLIRNILVTYFGFDESAICELHDEAATRDGILAAMKNLENSIDSGDIVVFHFSGHGSRRTSPNPEEGSDKDSTIMPHDSGRHPLPNLDIASVEINAWLANLAKKTSHISMTFDCCHSGTITRDPFAATVRAVPDDTRSLDEMGVDAAGLPELTTAAVRGGDSNWLDLGDSYVVMSGCRDNEYSHEYQFAEGDDEVRNGALTHFLTAALTKAKPGSTYRDIFELAHQGVNSKFPTQNPQIEGALDREIFGTREIEPLRFIPVTAVDGDQITLDGGAAHGLVAGSVWTAYPQGTKDLHGAAVLGNIEITSVGPLSSAGKARTGHNVTTGARCVEKAKSAGQFQLKVDLTQLPGEFSALLQSGIDNSDLLSVATDPNTADIRAYVLDPRDCSSEGNPVPQLEQLETRSWAFVDPEGALTMPVHPTDEEDVIKLLIENLETASRYRNALNLDNPDAALSVEFNIYREAGGNWEKANGGGCVFDEGECIAFEVVNNEDKPVFVSILDFGLSGKISLLYPPRTTSELIEPGKALKLGTGERRIRLGLPDNYGQLQGTGALKAFITNEEADFRWLQQEGTRDAGRRSGLQALFEAAYNGPAFREASFDDDADDDVDDWIAISRTFGVRRK